MTAFDGWFQVAGLLLLGWLLWRLALLEIRLRAMDDPDRRERQRLGLVEYRWPIR